MNNDKPLVTIGIPTYNRAGNYLVDVVRSAVSQTYENIEIVISDNCSSDNTGDVVAGYNDRRIKYHRHNANIGPNNNFNYCLECAKGSYFLLLHDDDLIDSDFVETCVGRVKSNQGVGIIRTGTRVIDGNGNMQSEIRNSAAGLSFEDFILAWYHRRTALYLCSTMFDTGKLRGIGGFHSSKNLFQDVLAEVKLAARYGREDIPEIKASFRRHGDEITFTSKVEDWCEDSLELIDEICRLVRSNADFFRRKSMEHFAWKNYGRAAAIRNPFKRWHACMKVSRYFDRRSPPPFWALFPGGPLSRYIKQRQWERAIENYDMAVRSHWHVPSREVK